MPVTLVHRLVVGRWSVHSPGHQFVQHRTDKLLAFLSYYQEALLEEHNIVEFNLIGSTPCFVVLLFSIFVGRLLDANHSRILIITGTCFVTVSMFLLSVVNGNGGRGEGSYPLTWLLQGPLMGLGMACFFVTSSQGELCPWLNMIVPSC